MDTGHEEGELVAVNGSQGDAQTGSCAILGVVQPGDVGFESYLGVDGPGACSARAQDLDEALGCRGALAVGKRHASVNLERGQAGEVLAGKSRLARDLVIDPARR